MRGLSDVNSDLEISIKASDADLEELMTFNWYMKEFEPKGMQIQLLLDYPEQISEILFAEDIL